MEVSAPSLGDQSAPQSAAFPWIQVFGNPHRVHIEVGPGRGEFLLRSAATNPQLNYYGIERSRSRTRSITQAIAKRALTNVRVMDADASCLLALLPAASVDAYYVFFPDPWWKRRHERRRLLTPCFVATLSRTLVSAGTISFATDVADYFALAQEYFAADPHLDRVNAESADAPSTSFARKALRRGVPIYASTHRRR